MLKLQKRAQHVSTHCPDVIAPFPMQETLEDADCLTFVLIDEVESLTAARKAAISGGEPSDSIRAVNALLTQLDALKRFNNVSA